MEVLTSSTLVIFVSTRFSFDLMEVLMQWSDIPEGTGTLLKLVVMYGLIWLTARSLNRSTGGPE